ncbi:hypothetical protein TFLX_01774 [Thermoflexales bacterium]|nr:hypothetical protein TFLX_01774 [Thermoflexales bacterium]
MSHDIQHQQFAQQFLERTVGFLEQEAQENHYNWYCMRQAIAVALILERGDLVSRVKQLWRQAKLHFGYEERLQIDLSADSFNQLYPIYPLSEVPAMVNLTVRTGKSKHIALSVEKRYSEAFPLAADDFEREQIIMTQIVLGDFDSAQQSLVSFNTVRDTKHMALLVFGVEYFRRDRFDQLQSILNDLRSSKMDMWDHVLLACGFAGREPWGGYPYADY